MLQATRKIIELRISEPQTGLDRTLYFYDADSAKLWAELALNRWGIIIDDSRKIEVTEEEAEELCEETIH